MSAKAPEPGRYRKRPVVVEAMEFQPHRKPWPDGVEQYAKERTEGVGGGVSAWHGWRIQTLEGPHEVTPGDFVITGIKGERYPCKPDIFAATYEAVDGAEAVNAEPPATPEPAAPMPRVSDEWVEVYAKGAHGLLAQSLALDLRDERECSTAAMNALAAKCEVVYVEEREKREAAEAQVAELEARIARIRCGPEGPFENCTDCGRAMVWQYDTEARQRGPSWMCPNCTLVRCDTAEGERDEARAALARANEALRSARFQAFDEALGVLDSEHIDGTSEEMWAIGKRLRDLRQGAQGSAAQKPEGP